MKEVARDIRNAGLTAGIWTSPFIAHETASVWKEHPHWILRDKKGSSRRILRAVEAVRRGMGDDSYFLMCGGLYDPIIGLVEGQRMAADVLSMWRSGINRDGKSQPFTVKQNMLRYYMNHWWNNDPDALMVRRRREMERELRLTLGLLNEEEVKTAVVNRYLV